jgi:hypothetical protein
MQNLTDEQLKEIVTYWKAELGLQDWRIGITICRESEMQLNDVDGENEYSHQLKTAMISILDVIDYGDRIIKQDQEKTIVHELLHCIFSPIDTQEILQDRIQHQMIETLARALVNARRSDNNEMSTMQP